MDTKRQNKPDIGSAPTSAFTPYVRTPPTKEVIRAKNDRIERKSAFARIKQLFSLSSE